MKPNRRLFLLGATVAASDLTFSTPAPAVESDAGSPATTMDIVDYIQGPMVFYVAGDHHDLIVPAGVVLRPLSDFPKAPQHQGQRIVVLKKPKDMAVL